MASNQKRRKSTKARKRRASTYDPIRGPRLKGRAEPAPASPKPGVNDPALFGEAAEDGLRMLAALETIPSLEPDFCDDLAAEASVTIIERAMPFDLEPPPLAPENARTPSTAARPADAGEPPHVVAEEYAAYHGPVDEAVVEIFEGPPPEPAQSGSRRKKGRPAGHRFFKALTGDDSG